MYILKIALISIVSLLTVEVTATENNEFPGRKKYPDVKTYSMQQLSTDQANVIIIDARSKYEFDTLRIKNAINIPVSDKKFVQQIKALRDKTTKPMVFYCNGHTCMKSYIAARKARAAKVKNVYAYDAGLFSWAKQYPSRSELLGQSPVNPQQIISEQAFAKRLLAPNVFSQRASQMGRKGIILDVRDKYQRGAAGFFPGQEKWISLNDKEQLQNVINKLAKQKRTLFIYDEVGKQVRWLQYALEQASVKNYYFMKKGAKGYYSQMMREFGITN